MRNILGTLMYKMRIFMQGRYGFDELSKTMMYISLAFMIISIIPILRILYFIAVLLMILLYARCFSKNIAARTKERNKYCEIKSKLTKNSGVYKQMFKDRNTHRYFKCKKCNQYTRVPKGLGKVEITCRVCNCKMTKKS